MVLVLVVSVFIIRRRKRIDITENTYEIISDYGIPNAEERTSCAVIESAFNTITPPEQLPARNSGQVHEYDTVDDILRIFDISISNHIYDEPDDNLIPARLLSTASRTLPVSLDQRTADFSVQNTAIARAPSPTIGSTATMDNGQLLHSTATSHDAEESVYDRAPFIHFIESGPSPELAQNGAIGNDTSESVYDSTQLYETAPDVDLALLFGDIQIPIPRRDRILQLSVDSNLYETAPNVDLALLLGDSQILVPKRDSILQLREDSNQTYQRVPDVSIAQILSQCCSQSRSLCSDADIYEQAPLVDISKIVFENNIDHSANTSIDLATTIGDTSTD